jgi:hypothetical protein
MDLRLGDYVVAGELINRRPNCTHGWLALRGEETPVIFQLTGNCSASLRGQHIRFALPDDRPAPAAPPLDTSRLAWQQIGPTGEITLRDGVPGNSPAGRPSLYMEWFSQNGRVVLELVDPDIEWVAEDDDDRRAAQRRAESASADAAEDEADIFLPDSDDGEEAEFNPFEVPPPDADEDADDPYGLFPPGLDDELAEDDSDQELADEQLTDEQLTGEEPSAAARGEASTGKRSWDEVIPGIDPETKRMYEQWDEVTEGSQDVPFTEVFDPPVRIYTPEQLAVLNDATAESVLKELLTRLALLGVAVAVCEHFSPKLTYRMIAQEILPRYGVHPRLPQIGWVQHYDTSEFCRKCQEEFDRKFEEERRQREEHGGELRGGELGSDEVPPSTGTQPL